MQAIAAGLLVGGTLCALPHSLQLPAGLALAFFLALLMVRLV
jgi:hypothetical protein